MNIDTKTLSKRITLTIAGGVYQLNGTGVQLRVPPNAVKETTNIVFGLSWNPIDFPPLQDLEDYTRVTPVVFCEPSGTHFQVPVTLIVQHCGDAFEKDSVLQFSKKSIGEEGGWVKFVENIQFCIPEEPEKDVDNGSQGIVTPSTIMFVTTHFSKYSGFGRSKKISFSVYGEYHPNCESLQIHVFLFNNTSDEKQVYTFSFFFLNFSWTPLWFVELRLYETSKTGLSFLNVVHAVLRIQILFLHILL